jgi:dihydroxyacetone kinase-like protein
MSATITLTTLTDWLELFQQEVTDQQGYLTELDSAIGDADHGINMARGMTAVKEKIEAEPAGTADEMLKKVGMTLVTSVGGASGPLYGTFFLRMSTTVGPVTELDAAGLGSALRAGLDGLVQRGRPELGDKTMYDALAPALDAYDSAVGDGKSIQVATADAASAAAVGRDGAKELVARKGRASYLGERSAGHLDPGSVSATMLMETLSKAVAAP